MSCRQNSWHYAGINISFSGVIFSISAFVLVFSTLAWKTINIVNLPNTISTVFDMIIADHLTAYFEHLLSSCLSAYLKGCSSQHVILRLTEYWRQALDDCCFVGTVAMDFHAYGLSMNACQLIVSYANSLKSWANEAIGRLLIVVYHRVLLWDRFCSIYFVMTYFIWKWIVKLLIMPMITISIILSIVI